MTSFTKLIKPDSTELERYFLSVYTGNLWDALEKIKDWHSPDHIEKEVQMKLLKLQQQALPVVPEDVDKAIKYLKTQNNFATFADFDDILTEKGLRWLNDFQFKDRRFGFGGLNNKLFILSHLAVTGYRVEKTQLFYLKHIDMSKRSGYFDFYLERDGDESLEHKRVDKDEKPGTGYEKSYYTFTQQEIDSMQTGSYEQIEVTE
ncbi:DUF1642 domain-containing protein [Lactococcus lactis]|uniref:DUF1642 domain-containing protein n=1 Tax=Lactococcus lactis TaxID=1358 RepID=UPI0028914E11|nr:DUF1642 domain-containing protein [Lactococcus lactis]MDT2932417.1 DUF1642 domain-containing protein [Lactococcus lactis]